MLDQMVVHVGSWITEEFPEQMVWLSILISWMCREIDSNLPVVMRLVERSTDR